MAQDEYTLTSSDEAFALGEEGRRLLLGMAVTAYERALRATLSSLKEAFDERSWTDYEQNSTSSYVGGLTGTAYSLVKQACGMPEYDHSAASAAVYRLHTHVTSTDVLRRFTYFQEDQWRRQIPTIIARYREAQDGTLRDTLERVYAATDPTLAAEYADTLMPTVPGR